MCHVSCVMCHVHTCVTKMEKFDNSICFHCQSSVGRAMDSSPRDPGFKWRQVHDTCKCIQIYSYGILSWKYNLHPPVILTEDTYYRLGYTSFFFSVIFCRMTCVMRHTHRTFHGNFFRLHHRRNQARRRTQSNRGRRYRRCKWRLETKQCAAIFNSTSHILRHKLA